MNEDMNELLKTCFTLGIKIAENVHGYRRKPNDATQDTIFELLAEIAAGKTTLMDTPEEIMASLANIPPHERPSIQVIQATSRNGRENEQHAAKLLLQAMPK